MSCVVQHPNRFLRSLFTRAVSVADPMQVVPAHLPTRPKGRVLVIGAGKASARMAEAVESVWGPCEGLVITRYGYARPSVGVRIVEAAHPVPDAAGEAATRDMLALAGTLGPDDLVLALISGGGSALLCSPVPGVTLEEKMTLNSALLASGAPIDEMNLVRKHLSRVKGGQLAAACAPARVLSLMISDVPGDDPSVIASGPTVGEGSTPADARAVVERRGLALSASVHAALSEKSRVIAPNDLRLRRVENRIIAAPSASLEAAADEARQAGVDVQILGDSLEGEARNLAADQVRTALEAQAERGPNARPLLLLSGGECTVTRRGSGVGGPNAEFALAAALALNEAPGIHLLACDTDGVDGAAEVAGAVVGPQTLTKAKTANVSARKALENNDAHRFFEAIDDQVVTGPTLTNVNDFRAILVQPDG